ncbi:DNA-binding transcriptional regulator, MarR family [Desulfatibacillum alkenivorans DSM 16219]|jgi:DNA-binding MarR family transcriptional regulator|uniref:DNA-binding transcriptional regulator, MarR family n=1 Tax=Desulfatibacillum alkenivorans DSM 16219 TaxID=1121393 RepID=A0A1M6XIU4_9BACT|nr:MarR family transcriptional regulator [Desulfatibacillum alkenivorans]SHL05836.1 DNA-binding transcriptional regulator, MarR family [Desulfatibacillum alkenivorans DSM 16219]
MTTQTKWNGDKSRELSIILERMHGLAVTRLFHSMARTMHAFDLSYSQMNALFRIFGLGPQSIASLAEGVHLSHAAASRMVDKLVRQGLVKREPNPDCRRKKDVILSPAGLEIVESVQAITAGAYEDFMAGVPENLLQDLLDLLRTIKPHLPEFLPGLRFPERQP